MVCFCFLSYFLAKYSGRSPPGGKSKSSNVRKLPQLPTRPGNKPTGKNRPIPKPNENPNDGFGYGTPGRNIFGTRTDGYGNKADALFGGM